MKFKNINNLKYGKKHFIIRKNIIFLILLFTLFLSLSAISYAKSVSTDISKNVFRLHVLANSNSEEDQNLKYKVRDSLISYMNSLCADVNSKSEAIEIAESHVDEFKQIALDVIKENGYNYNVEIEIGNFEFPTKQYGDISFPAGFYDALRVKIGKAEGQNWWCVMFPPLCFVDVTSGVVPEDSKENLQENLSDEDYSIVSQDDAVTKFKFKIVELFQNLGLKLANN